MVKNNLDKLSDEQLRIQIESRTRVHLDWIRVNGSLLGAVLGGIFGLVDLAVKHIHPIIAAWHLPFF